MFLNENSIVWKKAGNKYFHQFKMDGLVRINEMEISLSSLKKAIYYLPVSDDFCRINSIDKVIHAFIQYGSEKIITPVLS